MAIHTANPNLRLGSVTLQNVSEHIKDSKIKHYTLGEYFELLRSFRGLFGGLGAALKVTENYDLRMSGSLGYLMFLQCDGLSVLKRLSEYWRLSSSFDKVEFHQNENFVYVRYQVCDPIAADKFSCLFKSINLTRSLIQIFGTDDIIHVSLGSASPEEARLFEAELSVSTSVGFDQTTIYLKSSIPHKTLETGDQILSQNLEKLVHRIGYKKNPLSYSERVRQIILRGPHESSFSLNDTAVHIGVTGRTLQRKLSHEGTLFSQLIDEKRRHTAVGLLLCSKKSMMDISCELGFSELSSFYRAFKGWFDTTPRRFRFRYCPEE